MCREKYFPWQLKISCGLSVSMELENEKTESLNENKNKENKNVDEFLEFISQQKLANTVSLSFSKTQNDMKGWKRYYFQENENKELCDIPEEELNSLLCKCL